MSSTRSTVLCIHDCIPESIVDGPGIRYVVFVQGCPHRCEGCHNPQTHEFGAGREVEIDTIFEEIRRDPLLSGVTFSGGEPFCQAGPLGELAKLVHAAGLKVMTYTGYTYEQLSERAKTEPDIEALLCETDILVDGPFVLAERDLTLRFRGSRNQRLLTLQAGKILSVD